MARKHNEGLAGMMRANGAASLRPGVGGLTVRCRSGLLVITQEGDLKDHELHPGDTYRTGSRGRVVVWALEESTYAVTTRAGTDEAKRAA